MILLQYYCDNRVESLLILMDGLVGPVKRESEQSNTFWNHPTHPTALLNPLFVDYSVTDIVNMATNDKYDRQLRLWGANGQKALMDAHILLVQADSVGTETLKNLVLPGVGAFTILDDFIVDENDCGCNFFVEEKSLGKPRAEVNTIIYYLLPVA